MTEEQQMRSIFAKIGSRGGKATAAGMTKKERSEKMRNAAKSRWSKVRADARKKKKAA